MMERFDNISARFKNDTSYLHARGGIVCFACVEYSTLIWSLSFKNRIIVVFFLFISLKLF